MIEELTYSAKVLADSVYGSAPHRITTFEVVFPRFVLAEFNTHCVLSRNSASSRAIPVTKQLRRVLESPFVPEQFTVNEPGMQSSAVLGGDLHDLAVKEWLRGRDQAVLTALRLLLGPGLADQLLPKDPSAQRLLTWLDENQLFLLDVTRGKVAEALNVHKQQANRVLEPYMWHTVIVTATNWRNFYALRVNPNAQPEIHKAAEYMLRAHLASEPKLVRSGEWHLPLIQDDEVEDVYRDIERWKMVSAGRCARVSYMTHDGVRDPEDDVQLAEKLLKGGHMSPFEHVARPLEKREFIEGERPGYGGKLRGWVPMRIELPWESDFSLRQPLDELDRLIGIS